MSGVTAKAIHLLIFEYFMFRNFERYSVVCRPWITIDGTTSKQLLRMFREMVLILILDNPGIPEVSGVGSVPKFKIDYSGVYGFIKVAQNTDRAIRKPFWGVN